MYTCTYIHVYIDTGKVKQSGWAGKKYCAVERAVCVPHTTWPPREKRPHRSTVSRFCLLDSLRKVIF